MLTSSMPTAGRDENLTSDGTVGVVVLAWILPGDILALVQAMRWHVRTSENPRLEFGPF